MAGAKTLKKIFLVEEPVYDSACTFYVGVSFEKVQRELRSHCDAAWLERHQEEVDGLRENYGAFLRVKLKSGLVAFMVWVRGWNGEGENLVTLNHEILHLVLNILEHKGTPIQRSNDEIICRLQGFYLLACLRVLMKRKGKA